MTLQEIFFLQPLVLSQDGSVECTLTTQHQLEVRSYVDSGASLHCTAAPAHVRRVERLLEVLRTSQSALGRQRPHAAPPARPHPAGALVAHASRRRRFFEHGGVALVCHAPPGHTAVYARPTRAITLEGAHLRARALAERGGRFGAAVAAAALATECGDQEARVVET